MPPRIPIHKGDRYGRLVVVKEVAKLGQFRMFLFRCDCGKSITVRLNSVRVGVTTSCGCYNKERIVETHKTHGKSDSEFYYMWKNMVARCHNESHPQYENYGGRGIRVCRKWRDNISEFISWAETNDYSSGMELDRRDNTKGYSPNNCRFVTKSRNNRNKRTNLMVRDWETGKQVTFIDLYEKYGHPSINVRCARIRYTVHGWSLKEALLTPKLQ